MRRALFLDRDGTLIHDRHYLADPAGVELLPGVADALRPLAGHALLVIVSNQSGIARRLIRPEQHEAVHQRFVALLAAEGVTVDAAYYCEHGPDDGCTCRKPLPGMLFAAAREHDIGLPASMMIGDKESDIAAGRAAGCATALFGAIDGGAADWSVLAGELRRRFL